LRVGINNSTIRYDAVPAQELKALRNIATAKTLASVKPKSRAMRVSTGSTRHLFLLGTQEQSPGR